MSKRRRINLNVVILPENYLFLYNFILEEEARGLRINMSRAINALIAQVRTGKPVQNETDFRCRRRPLTNLLEKLPKPRKSPDEFRTEDDPNKYDPANDPDLL
jgi:hypothetical protein